MRDRWVIASTVASPVIVAFSYLHNTPAQICIHGIVLLYSKCLVLLTSDGVKDWKCRSCNSRSMASSGNRLRLHHLLSPLLSAKHDISLHRSNSNRHYSSASYQKIASPQRRNSEYRWPFLAVAEHLLMKGHASARQLQRDGHVSIQISMSLSTILT